MNAIILAAGKQTRFKSDIPKCLMKYKDTTILEYNIKNLQPYVNNILIIASNDNYKHFDFLKNDKIHIIKVKAGGGSGISLYRAREEILKYDCDNYILLWSDTMNTYKKILDDFKNFKEDNKFYAPLVKEKNPYADFIIDKKDKSIKNIKFKKLNETIRKDGLHDLSIFIFPKKHLVRVKNHIFDKFEDDFNILYLYTNKYNFYTFSKTYYNIKDLSFNTMEEYKKLI